jgi:hypothetical protein
MAAVTNAYDALKDPAKRHAYDCGGTDAVEFYEQYGKLPVECGGENPDFWDDLITWAEEMSEDEEETTLSEVLWLLCEVIFDGFIYLFRFLVVNVERLVVYSYTVARYLLEISFRISRNFLQQLVGLDTWVYLKTKLQPVTSRAVEFFRRIPGVVSESFLYLMKHLGESLSLTFNRAVESMLWIPAEFQNMSASWLELIANSARILVTWTVESTSTIPTWFMEVLTSILDRVVESLKEVSAWSTQHLENIIDRVVESSKKIPTTLVEIVERWVRQITVILLDTAVESSLRIPAKIWNTMKDSIKGVLTHAVEFSLGIPDGVRNFMAPWLEQLKTLTGRWLSVANPWVERMQNHLLVFAVESTSKIPVETWKAAKNFSMWAVEFFLGIPARITETSYPWLESAKLHLQLRFKHYGVKMIRSLSNIWDDTSTFFTETFKTKLNRLWHIMQEQCYALIGKLWNELKRPLNSLVGKLGTISELEEWFKEKAALSFPRLLTAVRAPTAVLEMILETYDSVFDSNIIPQIRALYEATYSSLVVNENTEGIIAGIQNKENDGPSPVADKIVVENSTNPVSTDEPSEEAANSVEESKFYQENTFYPIRNLTSLHRPEKENPETSDDKVLPSGPGIQELWSEQQYSQSYLYGIFADSKFDQGMCIALLFEAIEKENLYVDAGSFPQLITFVLGLATACFFGVLKTCALRIARWLIVITHHVLRAPLRALRYALNRIRWLTDMVQLLVWLCAYVMHATFSTITAFLITAIRNSLTFGLRTTRSVFYIGTLIRLSIRIVAAVPKTVKTGFWCLHQIFIYVWYCLWKARHLILKIAYGRAYEIYDVANGCMVIDRRGLTLRTWYFRRMAQQPGERYNHSVPLERMPVRALTTFRRLQRWEALLTRPVEEMNRPEILQRDRRPARPLTSEGTSSPPANQPRNDVAVNRLSPLIPTNSQPDTVNRNPLVRVDINGAPLSYDTLLSDVSSMEETVTDQEREARVEAIQEMIGEGGPGVLQRALELRGDEMDPIPEGYSDEPEDLIVQADGLRVRIEDRDGYAITLDPIPVNTPLGRHRIRLELPEHEPGRSFLPIGMMDQRQDYLAPFTWRIFSRSQQADNRMGVEHRIGYSIPLGLIPDFVPRGENQPIAMRGRLLPCTVCLEATPLNFVVGGLHCCLECVRRGFRASSSRRVCEFPALNSHALSASRFMLTWELNNLTWGHPYCIVGDFNFGALNRRGDLNRVLERLPSNAMGPSSYTILELLERIRRYSSQWWQSVLDGRLPGPLPGIQSWNYIQFPDNSVWLRIRNPSSNGFCGAFASAWNDIDYENILNQPVDELVSIPYHDDMDLHELLRGGNQHRMTFWSHQHFWSEWWVRLDNMPWFAVSPRPVDNEHETCRMFRRPWWPGRLNWAGTNNWNDRPFDELISGEPEAPDQPECEPEDPEFPPLNTLNVGGWDIPRASRPYSVLIGEVVERTPRFYICDGRVHAAPGGVIPVETLDLIVQSGVCSILPTRLRSPLLHNGASNGGHPVSRWINDCLQISAWRDLLNMAKIRSPHRLRIIDVGSKWQHSMQLLSALMDEVGYTGNVVIIALRPRLSMMDVHYTQSHCQYRALRITLQVYEQTFESWMSIYAHPDDYVFMNDCHYYIESTLKWKTWIVGKNYPCVQGVHPYPNNEGLCKVEPGDSSMRIVSRHSGNSTQYEHDVMLLENFTQIGSAYKHHLLTYGAWYTDYGRIVKSVPVRLPHPVIGSGLLHNAMSREVSNMLSYRLSDLAPLGWKWKENAVADATENAEQTLLQVLMQRGIYENVATLMSRTAWNKHIEEFNQSRTYTTWIFNLGYVEYTKLETFIGGGEDSIRKFNKVFRQKPTLGKALVSEKYLDEQGMYALARAEKYARNCDVKTSGLKFSGEDGKPYTTLMWDNTTLSNSLYAMFQRQLGTLLEPDDVTLHHFKIWLNDVEFREERWDFILRQNHPAQTTPTQFVDSHKNWSLEKRQAIHDVMSKQFAESSKRENWRMVFDLVVKNGEEYFSKKDINSSGDCWAQESRPRAIMAPSNETKGLLAWVQVEMMRIISKYDSAFTYRENTTSFKLKHLPHIRKMNDPVCLSIDGSAHDSHQHWKLIKIVDNKIFKLFSKQIRGWVSGYNDVDADLITRWILWQATKSENSVRLRRKWAGKYRVIAKWKLKGTVFSGHPSRTTLGNTLRVIMYNRFYCHEAGLKKEEFHVAVSGDDAVIWVERNRVEQLKATIFRLSSKVKTGNVGLGQCYKEIRQSEWHDIDFCSKWGWCFKSHKQAQYTDWVIKRKPLDLLMKSNLYTGSNWSITKNPDEHGALVALSALPDIVGSPLLQFFTKRLSNSPFVTPEALRAYSIKKMYGFNVDGVEDDTNSHWFARWKDANWHKILCQNDHSDVILEEGDFGGGHQPFLLKPGTAGLGGKKINMPGNRRRNKNRNATAHPKRKAGKAIIKSGVAKIVKKEVKKDVKAIVKNAQRHQKSEHKSHSNKLVHALDAMMISKVFPGKYDSPYVNGTQILSLPTMTYEIGGEFNKAMSFPDWTLKEIGSDDFVVLAYCPSLSNRLGARKPNQMVESVYTIMPETERMSGFLMFQTNDLATPLEINLFGVVGVGKTLLELVGSNFDTFADSGFVYAGEMDLAALAANANIVGKCWHGKLRIGQLYNERESSHNKAVTISLSQLVKVAKTFESDNQNRFSLHGAVVNHAIINNMDRHWDEIGDPKNTSIQFLAYPQSDLGNETFEYLILPKAVMAINSTANSNYAVSYVMKGNVVYQTSPTDTLASNLHKYSQEGLTMTGNAALADLPGIIDRQSVSVMKGSGSSSSSGGGGSFLSKAGDWAWKNKAWALGKLTRMVEGGYTGAMAGGPWGALAGAAAGALTLRKAATQYYSPLGVQNQVSAIRELETPPDWVDGSELFSEFNESLAKVKSLVSTEPWFLEYMTFTPLDARNLPDEEESLVDFHDISAVKGPEKSRVLRR